MVKVSLKQCSCTFVVHFMLKKKSHHLIVSDRFLLVNFVIYYDLYLIDLPIFQLLLWQLGLIVRMVKVSLKQCSCTFVVHFMLKKKSHHLIVSDRFLLVNFVIYYDLYLIDLPIFQLLLWQLGLIVRMVKVSLKQCSCTFVVHFMLKKKSHHLIVSDRFLLVNFVIYYDLYLIDLPIFQLLLWLLGLIVRTVKVSLKKCSCTFVVHFMLKTKSRYLIVSDGYLLVNCASYYDPYLVDLPIIQFLLSLLGLIVRTVK